MVERREESWIELFERKRTEVREIEKFFLEGMVREAKIRAGSLFV